LQKVTFWSIRFNAVAHSLGALLFFLMLFVPRTHQLPKQILLAILCPLILVCAYSSLKMSMHPRVLIWFCGFLSYGLSWVWLGAVRGNPGVVSYLGVNVIWVILYAVLVAGIRDTRFFFLLVKTLVFAGLAISIYSFAVVLAALGLIAPNPLTECDADTRVGIHSGFFQIASHNAGTLAFAFPFMVTLLFVSGERNAMRIKRGYLYFATALTFAACILTGRRALWLLCMLTPAIIYLLSVWCRYDAKKMVTRRVAIYAGFVFIAIVFPALFMQAVGDWRYEFFVDRFTSAFEEPARPAQLNALMKAFAEHPLFGTGFGVGISELIRDPERPWLYELSYAQMLHNSGILGFLAFALLVSWICAESIAILNRGIGQYEVILPLLTGMIGFLIANATNPYLASYDFMWIIFLPVAYINLVLLKRIRE
jgi:hypothetical protein